jgi:hypothetical protein
MKDDKMLEMLTALIDGAFANHYSSKENKMNTQSQPEVKPFDELIPLYESIEDYTEKTGKRFRMTKDQKQRNLSREEAFSEFTQIEKETLGELN